MVAAPQASAIGRPTTSASLRSGYLRLGEPGVAEPLQVGLPDRSCVIGDPFGEVHHDDIDLVEPCGVVLWA